MDKPANTFYSFGRFSICAQKRILFRDGEPLLLASKTFDLLLVLVENRGRVLVKDELMEKLWPNQIVEEANITVNMSALRKALGENPHEHLYIVTVPGRGYRFVASVNETLGNSDEMVIADNTAVEDNQQRRAAGESADKTRKAFPSSTVSLLLRRTSSPKAIAIAVLIAGLAVAAFNYFNRPSRALGLTERDTILLADFVNQTDDPVFDGTLKQALAVQLEQSPFLNVFSEAGIRETLRYMSRSADERVTDEIAREICERQGIKAMLTGSIATLGSHYVIALQAVNPHTGDVIAREQVEAESKEQVLKKIGAAATKLREKLGESLSSIEKFDA